MPAAARAGLVWLVALLAGAGPAEAAFPGADGKIAFSSNRDGHIELADGTSHTADFRFR